MNQGKDRLPPIEAPSTRIQGRSKANTEGFSEQLFNEAFQAEAEQTALFEASPLESQYETAFEALVQAKHDQVDRIEDRLENLIDQQSAKMQAARTQEPGILSRPGVRAKWQQQVQKQLRVMQLLQNRLESVREIRDGMGIHSPKIEELATRKLRAQEPELAAEFDDMREAQRLHQVLQRKQEQKKHLSRETERQGQGLTLGFKQAR